MKLTPETLARPRPQRGQLELPLDACAPRTPPPREDVCKRCQVECDYCRGYEPAANC